MDDWMCADCGVDTDKIHEYYMVHDVVWQEAGGKRDDMMLCVGCLEKRLGRELKPSDFSDAPLNDPRIAYQSRRLWLRVGGATAERLLDELGRTTINDPNCDKLIKALERLREGRVGGNDE
jgi:hypothetical protein